MRRSSTTTRSTTIRHNSSRRAGDAAAIAFGDYGFQGPNSFAVISVNNHGIMELHLLFSHV